MTRLNISQLDVFYGKKKTVEAVDLEIPDQQITAIIGPNGCGKSTLLKAIARIIPYEQGSILLDGKEIHTQASLDIAKKLAILPQSPETPIGLSVHDLVSYGRYPHQKKVKATTADKEVIDWALKVTQIVELKHALIDQLSGGQRQRVWIAMALAQNTDFIVLDEPTTYLDISHQLEVLELLKKLNIQQHRTIIMVLHDLNQAARYADYIVAMKAGKMLYAGTPAEVVTPERLKHIFNIATEIDWDTHHDCPRCISYNLIQEKGVN